jgi:hypothetical protein
MEDPEEISEISEISNFSLNIASKIPKELKPIFSPRDELMKSKISSIHFGDGLERAPSPVSPLRKNIVFTQKKPSQAPPLIQGLQTRRHLAKDKKVF